MTGYVAFVSHRRSGAALRNAVLPEQVDFLAITTLVGGTVGGYITYAGAHRLLDAGVHGRANVREISRASVIGVLVTGLMRVLLFLAVLGVVAAGVQLDPANPAASAFSAAAGESGWRVFGLILWAAAITSVIGASYTSVSFLTSLGAGLAQRRNAAGRRVHRALDDRVPAGRRRAGAAADLRRRVQRADPADRRGVMLWVALRRADLLAGYAYPRGLAALGCWRGSSRSTSAGARSAGWQGCS